MELYRPQRGFTMTDVTLRYSEILSLKPTFTLYLSPNPHYSTLPLQCDLHADALLGVLWGAALAPSALLCVCVCVCVLTGALFQHGRRGCAVFLRPGRKRDFSPLGWSCYFQTIEDVEVETNGGKDISLLLPFRLGWLRLQP